MNTFLPLLSRIIPLHFTPLGTACSLNKIIPWCPWPVKLLAVFLPLWWVLFSPLNFLLHILLCTAQVLSLKRVIYLLLRFLLPPVCWCFPKHILILDFFLELQNLGSSCPFDIIIKMSYWHLKLDWSKLEFIIPQGCSSFLTLYLRAIIHTVIKLKAKEHCLLPFPSRLYSIRP